MLQIYTLAIKEFIEHFKERLFILTYLLPIVTLFTIGFGMNMDTEHVRTVIIDRDRTPMSEEFIENFFNTKYFDSRLLNISFNEGLWKIRNNKIDLLIIIPTSFEEQLVKGVVPHIGVYIDGTFP
ncbi:MAG: ABC transporter permease, partial [Deferribacterota bacterium]|nr:ABC transporter permease [Deferribacterota bacterium]